MSINPKIADRIKQPTPLEVKQARELAGLTQGQAAALVSTAENHGRQTWYGYESEDGPRRRTIPLATWELFLLLTNQHPELSIIEKAP